MVLRPRRDYIHGARRSGMGLMLWCGLCKGFLGLRMVDGCGMRARNAVNSGLGVRFDRCGGTMQKFARQCVVLFAI